MVESNHKLLAIPGIASKEYLEERSLVRRMREAVSFCKQTSGIPFNNDQIGGMQPEHRMTMERCLTENYLLKRGMDYFGKRDLIYIDMRD